VWNAYDKRLVDRKGDGIMPRGDGTGPMGMGPMTGRCAGYCLGYAAQPMYRRGGRGSYYTTGMPGWARFGNFRYPDTDEVIFDEKERLDMQAQFLERQLEHVKKRLDSYKDETK
jgi:hypothetical protein